jgi:hypothetical protein
LLPWGVSLSLHACLLLATLAMVRSVSPHRHAEEVITYIRLVPPGAATDRLPPKPQSAEPPVAPQPPAQPQAELVQSSPLPPAAASLPTTPSPSLPSAITTLTPTSGRGESRADTHAGSGSAVGDATVASPDVPTSASPPDSPRGPKAEFYGLGGNARRIVYVVDASGSLVDSLQYVLPELQHSIHELSEQQHFTILFFQGGHVLETPPAGLKPATAYRKQQAAAWMSPSAANIRAAGTSSPIPALQRALDYKPDLIFLLSDNIAGRGGGCIDPQYLLDQVARLNTTRTKINTIQFLYPDPAALSGRPTLQVIAERTGGVYRFVSAREAQVQ